MGNHSRLPIYVYHPSPILILSSTMFRRLASFLRSDARPLENETFSSPASAIDELEIDPSCLPTEHDADAYLDDGAADEPLQKEQIQSFSCTGTEVCVGIRFASLSQARDTCQKYAKSALIQRSQKNCKFVALRCFRSGFHTKLESKVPLEFQRQRKTNKCGCSFVIKMKIVPESEQYEVYHVHAKHNHEVFDESELAQLPQNRLIPVDVKARMLELNSYGILKCSQILTLIDNEFDVPVTWNRRDVQNLFQSQKNLKMETSEFVALLNTKEAEGYKISVELNDETLRLERIFWISRRGIDSYSNFHDVLEIDATYKTNRW